jgi:hypothetical protein
MMTQEDVLEAIRKAVEAAEEAGNEPGTVVRREIQEAFEVGEDKARRICVMLVKDGVLVPERGVYRTDQWGIRRPSVGFRYVNGQGE